MIITIEGNKYKIPSSISEITLWQRIEFDKKYGIALREQLKKILEIKNEMSKELDFSVYHMDLACKTLSFFANIPLDVIQNTAINEVLTLYHHTMKTLSEDVDFRNDDFKLEHEFSWNDETWTIAAPELKYDSTLTFGELLDAKQWIKNLWELGEEKWEALLMLACVYFRKKGERYHEELAYENGERCQLLKKLPLSIALHVGFFLSVTTNFYMKTLRSSVETEEASAN